MATWFTNRGLEIDEQELFADLLTMVFSIACWNRGTSGTSRSG